MSSTKTLYDGARNREDRFSNEPEATYPYTDAEGVTLYEKVRFPGKRFLQRRPDGTWGRGGIAPVLYRLPEVLAAVASGERIYIVEGEKDADALVAAGAVATTGPDGAGKWEPSFSEVLAGATVVLVVDRDEVGQRHGAQVKASLEEHDCTVFPVEAAGGKDAADHLGVGYTLAEFVAVTLPPPEALRPPRRGGSKPLGGPRPPWIDRFGRVKGSGQ